MSQHLPLSELDVLGFVGRFPPEDWPTRLLPIYRSRLQPLCLLPPFEENEQEIKGIAISAASLEDMVDEGAITLLPTPLQARNHHLLWQDAERARYAPHAEAKQALDEIARQAILQALKAGLSRREARVQLFRSLRGQPTALANALLSVHFQLVESNSQVRPLREDLGVMAQSMPTELERTLENIIIPFVRPQTGSLNREEVSAIVMELRRARRDELAEALLGASAATKQVRQATRPALHLSWGAVIGQPV